MDIPFSGHSNVQVMQSAEKIWKYREQLFEYLEYYKQDRGYLLSFNFNKNKKRGIQNLEYQEKRILEVIV